MANDALVWSEEAGTALVAINNKLVYAASNGSGLLGSFLPTGLYTGSDDDQSRGIAVVGSTVFWLLADNNTQDCAVVRIDLAAPTPTPSVLVELDLTPYALAVVGDQLYVSGGWPNGKIVSVPLAGGQLTVHATGLMFPSALTAAPGGGILWIDGDYQLMVHDRAAGAALPRIVMSGNDVEYTTVLLVDDDRLFAASGNGLHVLRR
jgi:hypothetical protein